MGSSIKKGSLVLLIFLLGGWPRNLDKWIGEAIRGCSVLRVYSCYILSFFFRNFRYVVLFLVSEWILLQLTMQLNQNQTNPHLCKTSSEKRGVRNEMKAKGREVCSCICCVVFCTVSLLLKHKHTKNSYLRDLLRRISDTWRPWLDAIEGNRSKTKNFEYSVVFIERNNAEFCFHFLVRWDCSCVVVCLSI